MAEGLLLSDRRRSFMNRKRSLPSGERTTKLASAGELWDNMPKNSGDEYEPGQRSVEPVIEELTIQEVISGVFTATLKMARLQKFLQLSPPALCSIPKKRSRKPYPRQYTRCLKDVECWPCAVS